MDYHDKEIYKIKGVNTDNMEVKYTNQTDYPQKFNLSEYSKRINKINANFLEDTFSFLKRTVAEERLRLNDLYLVSYEKDDTLVSKSGYLWGLRSVANRILEAVDITENIYQKTVKESLE